MDTKKDKDILWSSTYVYGLAATVLLLVVIVIALLYKAKGLKNELGKLTETPPVQAPPPPKQAQAPPPQQPPPPTPEQIPRADNNEDDTL